MTGDHKTPWTTCVTLSFKPRRKGSDGGWLATVKWTWGKFCTPEMVQGTIATRYPTGMRRAIDQVMAMANQFGLVTPPSMKMALYAEDEDNEDGRLPREWKAKVIREATRRGWESYSIKGANDQPN